ncbi:MAG TPA: hypothetical protein VGB68_20760 [Pyrinomonadaceae bacterium]|jgi:hypothetical protein
MKKLLLLIILAAVTAQFVGGQSLENQNEKDKFIAAVQSLEDAPAGETAKETREWALEYSQQVKYPFCDEISFLFFAPEIRGEVMSQYLMKLAAFELENPGRKSEANAAQAAGLESALKVYEKIVKAVPKAKNRKLDSLVELRNKNQLMNFVKSANCK